VTQGNHCAGAMTVAQVVGMIDGLYLTFLGRPGAAPSVVEKVRHLCWREKEKDTVGRKERRGEGRRWVAWSCLTQTILWTSLTRSQLVVTGYPVGVINTWDITR
jgi:hypothetical protein